MIQFKKEDYFNCTPLAELKQATVSPYAQHIKSKPFTSSQAVSSQADSICIL
jgi:hypothetical protein